MQQLENTIVEKQGGQLSCFWVGRLETFEHELHQRLVEFVATNVDDLDVVRAMNGHFGGRPGEHLVVRIRSIWSM